MRELEATELRMRETEEEVRETERAAHEVSSGPLQSTSQIWAYIQRWDSIVAWSVTLSVHGADPIAEVKY
jgi:hypothetical protein